MKKDFHDEAELIVKVRSGDRIAFDFIYRFHFQKLFRLAFKITEDQAVAEDILQETFISFWEKGCKRDIKSLEGYLYQSIKFRCFMHLRSGHISRKHLDYFAAIAIESQSFIEEEYSAKEMEKVLQECIASLPEKCREVYHLSRVEELPNKEIAARLHISHKTVENQITKALKQLRLSLDKLTLLFFFVS